MFTETLLFSGWRLTADVMPEALIQPEEKTRFALPGAQELRAFADLLGGEEEAEDEEPAGQQGALFALPGRIPAGVQGHVCLSREIDFGRMKAEHAEIEIDQLCGSGSILLGEERLAVFSGGERIEIDLTDALRLGRKQTLCICFDDEKNAGVYGAAILRTRDDAKIGEIRLSADRERQTLSASVNIHAGREGVYAVRAALAGTQDDTQAPWRESHASFSRAGMQTVQFSLSMRAPHFQVGEPYQPPVLKVFLYVYGKDAGHRGILMDSRTIMTGYQGKAPEVFVPLMQEECALSADDLIGYAQELHVSALYAPAPVPDLLLRCAALKGIAILSCESADAAKAAPSFSALTKPPEVRRVSPVQACWQLCGMVLVPSVPDEQVTDDDLLLEAAGRRIDMAKPKVAARMAELRALRIRLRAEAARQGHFSGALCVPGEWREAAVAKALTQALNPLHLSVLPLRGAWWTGTTFSASLHVFIPDEMKNGTYAADAVLLNEKGEVVASFRKNVTAQNEKLGVIEGRLPDHACVLTLRAKLLRSGAAVETQEIPVCVGERGPLEAAFE